MQRRLLARRLRRTLPAAPPGCHLAEPGRGGSGTAPWGGARLGRAGLRRGRPRGDLGPLRRVLRRDQPGARRCRRGIHPLCRRASTTPTPSPAGARPTTISPSSAQPSRQRRRRPAAASIHAIEEGLRLEIRPPLDTTTAPCSSTGSCRAASRSSDYARGELLGDRLVGAQPAAPSPSSAGGRRGGGVHSHGRRAGSGWRSASGFYAERPSHACAGHWDPAVGRSRRSFATELSLAAPLRLRCAPAAEEWRFPIETVAKSERGLDRTRQGESVTLRWPVELGCGQSSLDRLATAASVAESGRRRSAGRSRGPAGRDPAVRPALYIGVHRTASALGACRRTPACRDPSARPPPARPRRAVLIGPRPALPGGLEQVRGHGITQHVLPVAAGALDAVLPPALVFAGASPFGALRLPGADRLPPGGGHDRQQRANGHRG